MTNSGRGLRRDSRRMCAVSSERTTDASSAASCMCSEPSRSFPTAVTGSSRSASASVSTSFAGASRVRSTGSRTSGALRRATMGWHETTCPLSVWSQPLYGGFNENWLIGNHTCGCGAVYRVTTARTSLPCTGTAICEVCGGVMDSWHQSTSFRSYVLTKQPR